MAENTVTAKDGRKVSKKALAKSFRNWYYGNLTCFSQEHMQTFGYLVSMLPIVEDLYDNKDDQTKALQTYSAFFNTEPQIGTMIVGVTVGLEEARANGQPVDDDTINGIRAGLIGITLIVLLGVFGRYFFLLYRVLYRVFSGGCICVFFGLYTCLLQILFIGIFLFLCNSLGIHCLFTHLILTPFYFCLCYSFYDLAYVAVIRKIRLDFFLFVLFDKHTQAHFKLVKAARARVLSGKYSGQSTRLLARKLAR